MREEEFQEVPENGKEYVPFSSHPPDWHTDSHYSPTEEQDTRKRPVPEYCHAEDITHSFHYEYPYSAEPGRQHTNNCRSIRYEEGDGPDYEDERFYPVTPLYRSNYLVKLRLLLIPHTRQAYPHRRIPAYSDGQQSYSYRQH